jgi:hypothetical protein
LEEGEEHEQEDPVKNEEPIDDGEEDPVKKQAAEKEKRLSHMTPTVTKLMQEQTWVIKWITMAYPMRYGKGVLTMMTTSISRRGKIGKGG